MLRTWWSQFSSCCSVMSASQTAEVKAAAGGGGGVASAVTAAQMCGDSGCLEGGRGSDGFGRILFADEDFQEAELGFDSLVLPVLLQHGHPVLLLDVSAEEEEREGHQMCKPLEGAGRLWRTWTSRACSRELLPSARSKPLPSYLYSECFMWEFPS